MGKFINAKLVCKNANPDDYHRCEHQRGDPKFIVSSSMLRLFAQNGNRWRMGYESPESDSKDFGAMLDARLLTPEQFETRFAVKPETYPAKPDPKSKEVIQKPFNANSKWCQEWIAAQGNKQVISSGALRDCDTAKERLLGDSTIAEWVECSDKQVWLTAYWREDTIDIDIPVKVLLDFVPRTGTPFQKALGDLKCVRNAAQKPFTRQVYQLGWHLQAALYQDVYTAATKEDRPDWMFILTENYAPFEIGRRLLSQTFIELGRVAYTRALRQYAKSLITNEWKGYDEAEQFSLVEAEPWMDWEESSQMRDLEYSEQEQSNDIIP